MKKLYLLIMIWMAVLVAFSQTYQQTYLELDSEIPKDKSLVCEASTSIKLLNGLHCNPEKGNSVIFRIDRYGVFPPDAGVIGGPPSSGQDGVVGAIAGELNVNDIGAAVYSIPIMMPKGIGKMTPAISVTYNNQSKNGLLGWGWDLSGLSSIVRVGETFYYDGSTTPINFNDDRFVLDGKRLMLCSGSYGGNGALYKTEIDEMSKIMSYKDGYNGPARFIVSKSDGTVWEYGCTDDSRIESQNSNKTVLTWLVNKITDYCGNAMIFNYLENQSTGEHYINSIDYTLNQNAGVLSMFRVEFSYSDRTDWEFGYVRSGLVQTKKLLTNIIVRNMKTGAVLYNYSFDYIEPGGSSNDVKFMYHRLKSIGLTANGMKINDTKISWNKSSHYPDNFLSYSLDKDVFNKVPFIGDFNGDGYSDVLTVPYKVGTSYNNSVSASIYLNRGDGSFSPTPYYTFTFDKTLEWVYVVDFDGDGLDDVVPYYWNDDGKEWKSSVVAFLNRGGDFTFSGAFTVDRPFTIYPGDFCGEKKVSFFLEYNNVGSAGVYYPAIVYYDGNLLKCQALGHESYLNAPQRIVVEDVNGDGCSEIIYLLENFSIINKLVINNNLYNFVTLAFDDNLNSDDFLFPGDFNGDGYTDFLRYDNKTYWKILYSDGVKFKSPVTCLQNTLLKGLTLVPQDRYICSLQNLSMPSVTIRTADFDGDGKTDVGVFKNTGGNYYADIGFKVYKSAENRCDFSDIKRFYFNINYSHQYVHVGNFLGQENASILGGVRANPYNNEVPKIVSLNPHSAKYSVERITDGLGNAHGFDYEYVMPNRNGFYAIDYKLVGNNMRTVSIPVKALRADTVYSTNNNPCVTKYSYKNALYHTKGHGLLGFEHSETTMFVNNSLRETIVVDKDAGIMGDNCILLTSQRLKSNNNVILLREEYDYDKFQCAQNEKVIMPLITTKKQIHYDTHSANTILKTSVENIEYQCDVSSYTYSDVVNVKKTISGLDANYCGSDALACQYKMTIDYQYDNKVSSWIVARPKTVKFTKIYGDEAAVGCCEIYDYGGNNMYLVTRKTLLPNPDMNYADPLKLITDYSYDAIGNVTMQSQQTLSSKNLKIKRFNYDAEQNYRLLTAMVNENGWETSISYDGDYGNIVTTTDYNGFNMGRDSDPFGINVEKTLPGNVKNMQVKRWANGNKHAPNGAMYYCWDKTTGYGEKLTFYSKNGKKLREVSLGLNGEAIYVDITYDDRGNIASKSMPYKLGDDKKCYFYVYDNNDKLIEEVHPNGLTKSYSYNKLQTTITNNSPEGRSHTVVETVNPVGWRLQTVDIGGNTINYNYYSDGKVKSAMIGDNALTKVEYEYDNMRNTLKIKDPAYGEVSYDYNAFGELMEMSTPRNNHTLYNYDNMGNLIGRVESDKDGNNSVTTTWIYDDKKGKIGMLSQVIYDDYQTIMYDYDDLLRITRVNETVYGGSYSTCYSYDNANRPEVVEYPSGFAVRNHYSNSGFYRAMTNRNDKKVLWQTNDMNAAGYIADYQYGNGLRTQRSYNENSNQWTGISTKSDNTVYQNLTYSYDGFGNLVNRTTNYGVSKSESFVYDDFDRLTEVKLNNNVTGNMVYDDFGNILSKVADGRDVFYDAQYDESCPYAVSKVKINDVELYGINQQVDYTLFDKISYVNYGSNSLSIDYGYDHERIHSVEVVDGKRKEKTCVGDCEYVDNQGDMIVYTYLKGPNGVFAVCVNDDKGDGSISYVHKDHLESWCLVTDEQGKILQNVSFDAWGNPRNGTSWIGAFNGKLFCDKGFTGHEHLTSFGLIDMKGRAYDPVLSMMMSPDNYIQNPDFSQNYNRYSYCYNNPLSYNDPTGEWVEWLLYGAYNGFVNVVCNIDNIDNFQEGALAFGVGFIGGCITQGLSGSSWVLQIVGNVCGTVLESGVNSFVKQNTGSNLDWSILENEKFKSDVMYSLGSSLATSILKAYIVQPTDTDDGMSLGSLLCSNEIDKTILENTTGKIAGNLFAGRSAFDGFDISLKNLGAIMPYVKCVAGIAANGIEFEGSSKTLGRVFDKLLNIDASGALSTFGDTMNCSYSQFRALFFKT